MKSQEEVQALLSDIEEGLAELPDYNIFGDSNAEGKEEMRQIIVDLRRILAGNDAHREDVQSWHEGADSWLLSDYQC
jgi:hypothetical protein